MFLLYLVVRQITLEMGDSRSDRQTWELKEAEMHVTFLFSNGSVRLNWSAVITCQRTLHFMLRVAEKNKFSPISETFCYIGKVATTS